MTTQIAVRRIVTYERVSTEEQRRKQSIKTQWDVIERALIAESDVRLVQRYIDDGESGAIPLELRPAGHRFVADARIGAFDEVWVYRIDRLGRADVDPLVVWEELLSLGIKVKSVTQGDITPLMYHIHVALAAEERRTFMQRSADGLRRIITDGFAPGGIVAYGYRKVGERPGARLVPDDREVCPGWTAVDVVRWVFDQAAQMEKTDYQIAKALTALGIPTLYARDGREIAIGEELPQEGGKRKVATRNTWTPGRVGQIITNTTYRGLYIYGKRSKKQDKRIAVQVPALVSEEVWYEAQAVRQRHRIMPKNTTRFYLLRGGIVSCGNCGHIYGGLWHTRDLVVYYRCHGSGSRLDFTEGRCQGKSVRADQLEPLVWEPIRQWLLNPEQHLLDALASEQAVEPEAAVAEVERPAWERALEANTTARSRAVSAFTNGVIEEADLKEQLATIAAQRAEIEARLAALVRPCPERPLAPEQVDFLATLAQRVDELTDVEKNQIIALLALVTLYSEGTRHNKKVKAVIEFRFPDLGVVSTDTGRGSWH